MQTRSGPPSDLMALLVWPLVAAVMMALFSQVGMGVFNWLLGGMSLHAGESQQIAYEPAVITLSGIIVKEDFSDDASPIDRGKQAWILHLDQRISVPAKPGDEIDTEEKNVAEIHLNIDPAKHQIAKDAFGKSRFIVQGTLYHSHTTHHLRPIVMLVSTIRPAVPRPDPMGIHLA